MKDRDKQTKELSELIRSWNKKTAPRPLSKLDLLNYENARHNELNDRLKDILTELKLST